MAEVNSDCYKANFKWLNLVPVLMKA